MFEISAIDHIVLRTESPAAMIGFYCRVLNCVIERDTGPELGLTQLRAGTALIDIVSVDGELGKMGGGAPTGSDNNMDHFCLRLQPISEEMIKQHLQKNGLQVTGFSRRYGAEGFGNSVYIKDPDGNIVELRSSIG